MLFSRFLSKQSPNILRAQLKLQEEYHIGAAIMIQFLTTEGTEILHGEARSKTILHKCSEKIEFMDFRCLLVGIDQSSPIHIFT